MNSARALLAAIAAMSAIGACASGPSQTGEPAASSAGALAPKPLFFIGQDLDALRGYFASGCCVRPDGATAYLSLYRLIDGADFGGLGYAPDGARLDPEASWGAGHVGARQTAEEFGVDHLAIGLFIGENDAPNGLARIAAGEFDDEIAHLADFIQSVDGLVFLRIGYEFDGMWNAGQDDTRAYIAAWRRIVDGVRAHGVTNARYVWQASASTIDDVLEERHEDIRAWYPGDDYVDWMGLSWFMQPRARRRVGGYRPRTPQQLADEVVDFARERGKPVMIAEASPQGMDINERFRANISPVWDGPAGGDRVALSDAEIWDGWYGPLFDFMNARSDVVRALAYINVDWDSQPMWGPPYDSGFWGDTRLEANPAIAERFNAALTAWRDAD